MTIDPIKAYTAQMKYAKDTNNPLFAPHAGICFSCGKQIYNVISVEIASTELVTGCPICGRSFCD